MRRTLVLLRSGQLSKARTGGGGGEDVLPRGRLCPALKSESGFAGQKGAKEGSLLEQRISGNAVIERRYNYGMRGAALLFIHSVGGGRKGKGIATL